MKMSKSDDLFKRILMAVARSSGYTVAALALLFYGGGGLALPLALDWSALNLVAANFLGTMLAGLVSLGWLAVRVRAGSSSVSTIPACGAC